MKIHYVTGSRADFGLMQRTLRTLDAAADMDVAVVVTGQHLVAKYGRTEREVVASGLRVAGTVPVSVQGGDGAEMGEALATELSGMLRLWGNERPDLVLLLGDRGEMVAAALAAVHLGIHVAHIHGGERSGTLDESFRHVISKLAHFHFPATSEARERLVRMGEDPDHIHIVGAPGLVGLVEDVDVDKLAVLRRFGLAEGTPLALVVFHPVVQESSDAGRQARAVVTGVAAAGMAQVILRPNSDAGGASIDAFLDSVEASWPNVHVATHLERQDYKRLLASADVLVGNSSSGIIEAASFGTPSVNVGTRQNGRQRNVNTIDCAMIEANAIAAATALALALPRVPTNVYGDGHADVKLLDALRNIRLEPAVLLKQNSY